MIAAETWNYVWRDVVAVGTWTYVWRDVAAVGTWTYVWRDVAAVGTVIGRCSEYLEERRWKELATGGQYQGSRYRVVWW